MESTHHDALVAWKSALERCLHTQSFAMVDESIVLIYVDAPRVFYAAQALVHDDNDDQNGPLVVVMRLHPQITALLRTLSTTQESLSCDTMDSTDGTDALVGTLIFRDQASATNADASAFASFTPFFAPQAVNIDGGALTLYGETAASASQALTMTTLAMALPRGDEDPLESAFEEMETFVVMVEHGSGYVAREYQYTTDESAERSALRLFTIQKRECSSGSVAQLSLDEALEDYEACFQEHQEINGSTADSGDQHSLEIDVMAAFEVRDQSRKPLNSHFLLDSSSWCTSSPPTVVLFSQWNGLENVRSLLCKPPPQCASTLWLSSNTAGGFATTEQKASSPNKSLTLLQHLHQALRVGSSSQSWSHPDLTHSGSAGQLVEKFKHLLKNIDNQDEFLGDSHNGDDDHTNNTIESTVSMPLEGARDHTPSTMLRKDMDAIEKVWDFLTRHADGTESVQQILQEFMVFLSNTRVFPAPHPENDTALAKLMRVRHEEIQGPNATDSSAATGFAVAAQQFLAQPQQVLAFVIEAGEWKMKRDVAFWLAQTGFSSQECDEIVCAMPRFDVANYGIHPPLTHVHWEAMDHVLQLCSSDQSIHLPVSFMRKAVHDCVAFYVRRGSSSSSPLQPGDSSATTGAAPAILVDLQSFIPDRLRANLADPLYWNLRIAFNSEYEHRLLIVQDAFHSTSQINHSSLSMQEEGDIVLDDGTLRALHRNTPTHLLEKPEMIQFLSTLEDAREKRVYQQLHDVEVPTGRTRYDCTVRRLHAF